jgi:hypothetical protein
MINSSIAASATPSNTEKVATAKIIQFLDDFDPRSDGSLPKLLDPVLVEQVLRKRLHQSTVNDIVARQITELADFYHLTGLVPDFLKWLDNKLSSHKGLPEKDFEIAIAFTRAVGILGTDAQRQIAQKYYHSLLDFSYHQLLSGHPYAGYRMEALMQCYAEYAEKEPIADTLQYIEKIISELRKKESSQPAMGDLRRSIQSIRNNALPRIEGATRMKQEIMEKKDPEQRLKHLLDIYLNIDMRYHEYINRWAVRMIQQEARLSGNHTVIASFRHALSRIGIDRPSQDIITSRRARIFNVIEFFGGQLSTAEMAEMTPYNKRFELLSIEPS